MSGPLSEVLQVRRQHDGTIHVHLRCGHTQIVEDPDGVKAGGYQFPDQAMFKVRAALSPDEEIGRPSLHFCDQCPEHDEAAVVKWAICSSCDTPVDRDDVKIRFPNVWEELCPACWLLLPGGRRFREKRRGQP